MNIKLSTFGKDSSCIYQRQKRDLMPMEDDLFLGGVGRTQTIYQQQSTGEKHVLFYPTSPAPSALSEERRSWSQASSSFNANTNPHVSHNHKLSNNNQEFPRMKKPNEGTATDPPDIEGHSTTTPNVRQSNFNFRFGLYGWRKKCLYFLVLGLLVMVIVNLALTLWVLKVMEFSSQGMGQLKIVPGGVKLEGRAFVLDKLIASSIRSRTGQPIVLESSKNLTLSTRDEAGVLDNRIFLGEEKFECLANNFRVVNNKGAVLFSADPKEVNVGAETLRVNGEGGTIFKGSVQTPLVRAESGHNLRLESPTRSLEIHAPMGVGIESRAGDITLMAFNEIALNSAAGEIRLGASSVLMPTLPSALPSNRPTTKGTAGSVPNDFEIFQLCVCSNGKLFLSPATSVCAVSDDEHVCR